MEGGGHGFRVSRNRAAHQIVLNSTDRDTVNRNMEMRRFDGPESPAPAKIAPVVIIVMAATMIGSTSGLFIADRNALLLLKKDIASQLAGIRSYLFATADTASAQPEAPKVIPTGLPSIVAIYYSCEPGSAHMAFDLETADLVGTGKLRSPDRIYFDLQDRSRKRGTLKRPNTQKAVSIDGNLLTGVRISQRKPGATRIVLDLKQTCDFTYQTSPGPPSRLTVEIRPRPAGASAPD